MYRKLRYMSAGMMMMMIAGEIGTGVGQRGRKSLGGQKGSFAAQPEPNNATDWILVRGAVNDLL